MSQPDKSSIRLYAHAELKPPGEGEDAFLRELALFNALKLYNIEPLRKEETGEIDRTSNTINLFAYAEDWENATGRTIRVKTKEVVHKVIGSYADIDGASVISKTRITGQEVVALYPRQVTGIDGSLGRFISSLSFERGTS